MKTNLIKPLTVFATYLLLLGFNFFFHPVTDYHFPFITDLHTPWTAACEGFKPSDLSNNYWEIKNIKTDLWHVLFRNVGVKYEIRRCPSDSDTTTSNFELREIGPNYKGIYNDDSLLKLTAKELFDYWAKNNQGIEFVKNGAGALFLVGSADNLYVFTTGEFNNIVDATMNHFNNIQRGIYHPNLSNKINPNSHGRSNVLGNVKNTFGLNNNWPSDKVYNKSQASSSSNHCNSNHSGSNSGSSDEDEPCRQVSKPIENTNNIGASSTILALSVYAQKEQKEPEKQEKKINHQVIRDIRSPLDQFLIMDLFIVIMPLLASLFISITNIILYLAISSWIVITTYVLSMYWIKIVITKWYTGIKSIYQTVHNLVKSQIQSIKGINLLPFFFCLFIYILTNNLVGMIPYSFAPTSHFILTFFISFTIVLGCTILGFILHKLIFFSLLVPQGCPLGLLPLLVLIETVSYLARNVSLGLRLAANILSGHMLLNILSEFTYKIMDTNFVYFFIGIIPVIFIGGFSALELGIAFIQSQVFVVLSSSYTKDSLELH